MTNTTSSTPKTDAVVFDCAAIDTNERKVLMEAVPVEFARQQERMLAELVDALTNLGDWLAYGLNKADGAEPTAEDHAACERVAKQARAAIDKATQS